MSFAILADKPPIEELHQFLEFQLPRQWAPVFSDLPLGPQRKQQSNTSLQFSLMGPKLYVNTSVVKPPMLTPLLLKLKKNKNLLLLSVLNTNVCVHGTTFLSS